MNTDKKVRTSFICVYLCSSVVLFLFGCGKPSAANIELRKRLDASETQVQELKRQHEADVATIRSLQQQSSGAVVPTFPPERLEKLFTTHGLSLGRLTSGADLDSTKPGDEALKVYVVPTDDMGQPLKAAGSFVVEAFDLAKGSDNVAGRWEFNVDQARQDWFGQAMLYTYVLACPLQRSPEHAELTLKVTFHDELTGREFNVQKVVNVELPAASKQ